MHRARTEARLIALLLYIAAVAFAEWARATDGPITDSPIRADQAVEVQVKPTLSAELDAATNPAEVVDAAAPQSVSLELIQRVMAWFGADAAGRYMVSGAQCIDVPTSDWPGYEGLPEGTLKRCRYVVESCRLLTGVKKKTCIAKRKVKGSKAAEVVLLEPGTERFARWIVSACIDVDDQNDSCLRSLYEQGKAATGWQIPIAGIVFEAMGPNYVEYGYAFRDGITVRADSACGWDNGSPVVGKSHGGESAPTQAQSIACTAPGARPLSASDKARPVLTTARDLIAWQPTLAERLPHGEVSPSGTSRYVGAQAEAWCAYVRSELVKAVSADRNVLVTAKVFTSLGE